MDLVGALAGAAELLEVGAFVDAVLVEGLEDNGGVFVRGGMSSIGSSLTGVASPLSTECWDASASSPVFFFFTFFVLSTLVLVLVPDEEDD